MCSVVWYVTLVNKMFAMKIWQRCGNSSKLFYCRWLMSQNGDRKTSHLTHKYRFSYKNNNMKFFGCYNSYLSHIQQSGFNRYFFTWVYDEFVICLWIGPPHVVPFFRETPICEAWRASTRLLEISQWVTRHEKSPRCFIATPSRITSWPNQIWPPSSMMKTLIIFIYLQNTHV